MIIKIDHIGKVVNNLERSRAFYESLGFETKYHFEKPEHGYKAVYMNKDHMGLELFEFKDRNHPHIKIVDGHTALITDNIRADFKKFVSEGYEILSPIKRGVITKKYGSVKNSMHSFELLQK